MRQRLGKECFHVFVVQPVEDVLALTSRRYDVQRPQQAQLVRDRRLAYLEEIGQFADAAFVLRQQPDDTDTRGVGRSLEKFGDLFSDVLRQKVLSSIGWQNPDPFIT